MKPNSIMVTGTLLQLIPVIVSLVFTPRLENPVAAQYALMTHRLRLMLAFDKLVKVYHMFFNNDFSDLLSVPDYNTDIYILEKTTGKSGSYFRKNLKIPSEKRRRLINALIYKTRDSFLNETSSILSVLSPIVKIYNGLNNQNEEKLEKPVINYDMVKNSLALCSYFSSKTTIATLCRDMGLWRCIQ